MPTFDRSLLIFRRDLRLEDNTALTAALEKSKEVISCFFLDPRQVHNHPYRSVNGQQFLFRSLTELNQELTQKKSRLHLFYGKPEDLLPEILSSLSVNAVFLNRDYTPFSTARDESIYHLMKEQNVHLFAYHDALLYEPKETVKADGAPYTVFTPFYKKNLKSPPRKPLAWSAGSDAKLGIIAHSQLKPIDFLDELLPSKNEQIFQNGGRSEGISLIKNRIPQLQHYNTARDLPSVDGTSGLSAHLKFGTVSVREAFWSAQSSLSTENRFISELYWRDFFTTIGYFFPYVFGRSFNPKFQALEWNTDEAVFQKWCDGQTGFPIVDAGMRQLNTTGWMHNRVRMIVSSFLIKDLHIDWRWGERYFAQKLIDYDPAVNNGGWQWAASTGCDAQPYFRIFNPWLQQEKFDPQCTYIKKWIPEVSTFTAKEIHQSPKNGAKLGSYLLPMVDHATEKAETERRYNKVAKAT